MIKEHGASNQAVGFQRRVCLERERLLLAHRRRVFPLWGWGSSWETQRLLGLRRRRWVAQMGWSHGECRVAWLDTVADAQSGSIESSAPSNLRAKSPLSSCRLNPRQSAFSILDGGLVVGIVTQVVLNTLSMNSDSGEGIISVVGHGHAKDLVCLASSASSNSRESP
jgi:hypothetical protein